MATSVSNLMMFVFADLIDLTNPEKFLRNQQNNQIDIPGSPIKQSYKCLYRYKKPLCR